MSDTRKEPPHGPTTPCTVVKALLRAARRTWAWIIRLTHRAAQVTAHGLSSAGTRTITLARASRERLIGRWHTDSTYRRTLLAAISAIAATLLPHPATAAALGALVAERPVRPSHRRDPIFEDDDEDDYTPRRAPLDPWAPSPRRLWDLE